MAEQKVAAVIFFFLLVGIHKKSYKLLTIFLHQGVPYFKSDHVILGEYFVVKALP